MMHRAGYRLHGAMLAVALGLGMGANGSPHAAAQQELLYGSWLPSVEGLNSRSLPLIFRQIEDETKGAIKWRLIAGGQIADGKTTYSAIKDGLMQAGLGVPPTHRTSCRPTRCCSARCSPATTWSRPPERAAR